jgi:ACS family hexuronate transporter-like MFS transporter
VLFATVFSWRSAFFLAGVPGICVAILVALFIREPQRARTIHVPGAAVARIALHIRELFGYRNIRLCALLSCFLNAWYFGTLTFLPLYLVRFLHFTPKQMSMVLASSGIGAVLSAVIVPLLSDRFGRRPVMVIFALIGAIGPLGAVTPPAGLPKIACLMFVGAWGQGLLPLCIGTVPLESVPNKDATASGLMMLIGMIAGGIAGPAAFGYLADAYDLSIPLWGCASAAIIAALICSRLSETAPALAGTTGASLVGRDRCRR